MSKRNGKLWIAAQVERLTRAWNYCSGAVWADTRNLWWVNVVKTLNITVRSFFNKDLQSLACALTYRTMLAIVPAMALLFAIGRGLGFQSLLEDELFGIFPGHQDVIRQALVFVDSYLNQASEGIFVGVGIVFLLWTLISLMDSVEQTFDSIWCVKQGRSFWRKVTDYTAMFLILPVLMICAGGLLLMVSNTIKQYFDFEFITPIIKLAFEFGSYAFMCLFFAVVFMLVPNTKVRFRNAMIAGFITGTGFYILQWLFVTGQLYVAKYNAIYGSFSFLPLLLIWMQLAWVICLSGALICYASQSIFQFTYSDQISHISQDYAEKTALAIAAVMTRKFVDGEPPVTEQELAIRYCIPTRLISGIFAKLIEAGIAAEVVIDEKKGMYGYQPAMDPARLTVGVFYTRLNRMGNDNFIPKFDKHFPGVIAQLDAINATIASESNTLLSQIEIKDTK